jgi:hypothetical protein
MISIWKQGIGALLMACVSWVAWGQNKSVILHIGDSAPPFKYSKWIKGKLVESFQDDARGVDFKYASSMKIKP